MKAVSPNRQLGSLLEKVANAAALTAAVAFGLSRLLNAEPIRTEEGSPSATDDYFDNPQNREAILTAIERDKRGIREFHDLIES